MTYENKKYSLQKNPRNLKYIPKIILLRLD